MIDRACILGTGKMARDIGLYLSSRGVAATGVSTNPAWADEANRAASRGLRRLSRDRGASMPGTLSFAAWESVPQQPFSLVIEATREDPDRKREALARARDRGLIASTTLIVSNSSSIGPWDLGDDVIGVHFFYPLRLTTFAELIAPEGARPETLVAARDLLTALGVTGVEENAAGAFAANRILLPLQNELFRLLVDGADPRALDQVSVSDLLAVRQLSMLDSVGLETVLMSVQRYEAMDSGTPTGTFDHLRHGLAQLLAQGKRGAAVRQGILVGAPLPWPRTAEPFSASQAADTLRLLLINTCCWWLHQGLLDTTSLNLILRNALLADTGWSEATRGQDTAGARHVLEAAHAATGMPYFAPCPALEDLLGKP